MLTRNDLRKCAVMLVFILVIVSTSSAETTNQPALVLQAGHTSSINSVVLSADGKLILTASDDQTIKPWDAASGRVIRVLTGHTRPINRALFSPDSKMLAATGFNDKRTIELLNPHTGELFRELPAHASRADQSLALCRKHSLCDRRLP